MDPPVAGTIKNYGTIINDGSIMPCTIELLNNGGYGRLNFPGSYPELFKILNYGTIINNGSIYNGSRDFVQIRLASVRLDDGTVIEFYNDWTFVMLFTDGFRLTGNYTFYQNMLAFILKDGTVIEPPEGTATVGDPSYSFPASSGRAIDFTLRSSFVSELYSKIK